MLYGGEGKVDALLADASGVPDVEVNDEYGVVHRLWKVSDREVIRKAQEHMADRKLIIADGHHRYETALAYRNERRQAAGGRPEAAPYDSVMMTFVDMDGAGLLILPTHRVVFGLPAARLESFAGSVRRYFNIEEVDPALDGARARTILKQAGLAGTALLAVMRERAFLLHTPKAIGTAVFGGLSLRQQALDVVQLHKCLLEGCLEISEEAIRNQLNVSYVRDAEEALTQVRGGQVQIAFLMNPVSVKQVRDIAFGGEVLPQKSTDFYPKLLSGLTIYALA